MRSFGIDRKCIHPILVLTKSRLIVTPDPRFFFTNPGYQEAYANLLYGIRERKGFLAVDR